MRSDCPACGSSELETVVEQQGVPVNSCLLVDTLEEAENFPTGSLVLTFCHSCGFVFNRAFRPALSEYSARYEETQGYSPRFVDFARDLATRWVERHDLSDRTVLEIGCGTMGEFLRLMVEAGAGHGIGIDPALQTERIAGADAERFTWLAEFYDQQHASLDADAIVCRHTLEHIAPVGEFVAHIRHVIGDRRVPVLFELPDVLRVLEEVAFWDVYYEHCSYFSAGSLARLFRRSGFEVVDLGYEYDGQYLVIDALPSTGPGSGPVADAEDDMEALRKGVRHYRESLVRLRADWSERLRRERSEGRKVVIWGAGSKGVAFLTGIDAADTVSAAVDINPVKRNRFMAGTGHRIIGPNDLLDDHPDVVVAMNPVYLDEIGGQLSDLGIQSELLAV